MHEATTQNWPEKRGDSMLHLQRLYLHHESYLLKLILCSTWSLVTFPLICFTVRMCFVKKNNFVNLFPKDFFFHSSFMPLSLLPSPVWKFSPILISPWHFHSNVPTFSPSPFPPLLSQGTNSLLLCSC